jgi:hypothetical protein
MTLRIVPAVRKILRGLVLISKVRTTRGEGVRVVET